MEITLPDGRVVTAKFEGTVEDGAMLFTKEQENRIREIIREELLKMKDRN